ncbi:MAG TPA: cysteine desulfurase [Aggregatilineales bacterium]|nr:cysteine desulfurase [Anaerolineales bacterium]HRE47959.1 cysteine desulfurase [Aggregatilineales bacterium]
MTTFQTAPMVNERMAAARTDFPILQREVRPGVPLIYLDSGATSQKPTAVIEAESRFYREINANVHRGIHTFSEQATTAYEAARVKVKTFINAAHASEIIFVRNTTEAINLVAYAWGLANLHAGDVILVSEMEHHANIVPWQIVGGMRGAVVRPIPITAEGQIDLNAYHRVLNEGRVRVVAVTHVSNVLGTITPINEMIAAAKRVEALTVVDAAQSAPHMALDVQAMGADFVAFSGHKMCAPTGIGVLYGRRERLAAIPPFLGGGSMIKEVRFSGTTFAEAPQKFEAGTPNIAGAVGLGAAIDYLTALDMAAIHAHEVTLIEHAIARLKAVPGVQVYGPPADQRAGLVAFTLTGVHPHDVAAGLDNAGIAVRAGHHCAMPLHEKFGLAATIRASFYLYNTLAEADALAEAVEKVRAFFVR